MMAPDKALKTYPVGLFVRLQCFGAQRGHCACHRLDEFDWSMIIDHLPDIGVVVLRSKRRGTFEVDGNHPINGYRYECAG